MSSCCHLLGRPLDLFPLLGCHSVQRLVHLLSFILAICPARFHFCYSVHSIVSVVFGFWHTVWQMCSLGHFNNSSKCLSLCHTMTADMFHFRSYRHCWCYVSIWILLLLHPCSVWAAPSYCCSTNHMLCCSKDVTVTVESIQTAASHVTSHLSCSAWQCIELH